MAELEALPMLSGMMGGGGGGGMQIAPEVQTQVVKSGSHVLMISLIVGTIVILGVVLAIVFLSGKCSKQIQTCSKNFMDCKCLDCGDCNGC